MVAMLVPTGPGGATLGVGNIAFAQDLASRSAWAAVLRDLQRLKRLSGDRLAAAGSSLRTDLAADTSQGLGPRMGRTWNRPRIFSGPAPVIKAALVGNKAPNIILAHDLPTIRITASANSRLSQRGLTPKSSHRMLAIPTREAGERGRGRFSNRPMTPGVYEQAYNVRLVRVGNVLIDPTLKTGKAGKKVRGQQGTSGGLKGAVVFILVPQVTLRKRINTEAVGQQALDRLMNQIASDFLSGVTP